MSLDNELIDTVADAVGVDRFIVRDVLRAIEASGRYEGRSDDARTASSPMPFVSTYRRFPRPR